MKHLKYSIIAIFSTILLFIVNIDSAKADEISDYIKQIQDRARRLGIMLSRKAAQERTKFMKEWVGFSQEQKQIYEIIQNAEALYFIKNNHPIHPNETAYFLKYNKISQIYLDFTHDNLLRIYNKYFEQKSLLPHIFCMPVFAVLYSPRKIELENKIVEILMDYAQNNKSAYPYFNDKNIDKMTKDIGAKRDEYSFVRLVMYDKINTKNINDNAIPDVLDGFDAIDGTGKYKK